MTKFKTIDTSMRLAIVILVASSVVFLSAMRSLRDERFRSSELVNSIRVGEFKTYLYFDNTCIGRGDYKATDLVDTFEIRSHFDAQVQTISGPSTISSEATITFDSIRNHSSSIFKLQSEQIGIVITTTNTMPIKLNYQGHLGDRKVAGEHIIDGNLSLQKVNSAFYGIRFSGDEDSNLPLSQFLPELRSRFSFCTSNQDGCAANRCESLTPFNPAPLLIGITQQASASFNKIDSLLRLFR